METISALPLTSSSPLVQEVKGILKSLKTLWPRQERLRLEKSLIDLIDENPNLATQKYRLSGDDNDHGDEKSLLYLVCAIPCAPNVIQCVFEAFPAASALREDLDHPSALSLICLGLYMNRGMTPHYPTIFSNPPITMDLVGPIGEACPDAYQRISRRTQQTPKPVIRWSFSDQNKKHDLTDYPNLAKHLSRFIYYGHHRQQPCQLRSFLCLFQKLRSSSLREIHLFVRGSNDVEVEFLPEHVMRISLSLRRWGDLKAVLATCSLPLTTIHVNVEHVGDHDIYLPVVLGAIAAFVATQSNKRNIAIRGFRPRTSQDVTMIADFLNKQQHGTTSFRLVGGSLIDRYSWPNHVRNSIAAASAVDFSPLERLTHLEELTLFSCFFGDALVQPIINLLRNNASQLTKLDVQFNHVGPNGLKLLLDAAGQGNKLRTLSCDTPDEEASRVLLGHLESHNCTLQDFTYNGQKGVGQYQATNNDDLMRIHFYCELNWVGRGKLRVEEASEADIVRAFLGILEDPRFGQFRYMCSDNVETDRLGFVYGLLRDCPPKWSLAGQMT